MTRWPDFIIIGAMKSATSTLHEQLARQPGIFMTTPKEPCYFSDDGVFGRGQAWYSGLFQNAPQQALCGESSTHYTKLPTYPHTIARMRECLPPHVKFIYIMRHPIDRLLSQYVHEWTQRVVSCGINEAVETLPELTEYSRYAMQIEPYLDAFGTARVLPMFFERLASAPQAELERACQFIGYNPRPLWDESLREQNVSSERMRKSILRDVLVNMPGLKHARCALVPQSIRDSFKSMWMMKRRPELSPSALGRLTEVFDRDLANLGQWLGLPLCCGNFKATASQTPAAWDEHSRSAAA